jgi:phosphate uptake regulator
VFMLRRGHEMFSAATARLLENEILDVDLEAMDREVNRRERHLRGVVLRNIGARSEARLVEMLKLLGVVHEAERIGDLAKTLSRAAELADGPRLGSHVVPLRDLRDRVGGIFALTLAGFEGRVARHAEDVLRRHEGIKVDIRARIEMIARDPDILTSEAVALALGARMMGRVSSHLANIASAVIFPFEDLRRTHTAEHPDESVRET